MSPKNIKLIYWGSTGFLALFMAALSVGYFTVPYLIEGMTHLGFPDYFRYVLGPAKGLGAIALITPVPERVKVFTYDGFAIMFVCGSIAHWQAGDPLPKALGGVIALILLVLSGVTRSKISKEGSRV